ncbi:hypothetical protein T439DRAFT_328584 [Meredithblackwellia eburnea MCA 4105]
MADCKKLVQPGPGPPFYPPLRPVDTRDDTTNLMRGFQQDDVTPRWADRSSSSSTTSNKKVAYCVASCGFVGLLYLFASTPRPSTSSKTYSYPPFRISTSTPSASSHGFPLNTPPPPSEVAYPTQTKTQQELYSRLDTALALPIKSYDESLSEQLEYCPLFKEQTNPDQVRDNFEWYTTVSEQELEDARAKVVSRVAKVFGVGLGDSRIRDHTTRSTKDWNSLFGDGRRGIVYTGGNADTGKRLLNSLTVLRNYLNCTLPVEIWAFEDELRTLGGQRDAIEKFEGITLRAATRRQQEGRWGWDKQFQIKGEAIANSAFSEVLYLDSDNVPARDPTFLFDSPVYKENGIVLWPDFAKDSPANPIWRLTGRNCDPSEWQAESGQVLVNKLAREGLNLAALIAIETMQREHKFWFKLSGGDKDTFRYGFFLLDLPYTPVPHYLSAGGSAASYNGHTFCGHTMLQYGLSPEEWSLPEVQRLVDPEYEIPDHAPPLFVHANLLKHSGGFLNWITGNSYDYHRGNTFQQIKLAIPDHAQNSTSLLLRDIRYTLVRYRGHCTDIFDSRESDGLTGFEQGRVSVLEWKSAWGGMMSGFEDMFFDAHGVTA